MGSEPSLAAGTHSFPVGAARPCRPPFVQISASPQIPVLGRAIRGLRGPNSLSCFVICVHLRSNPASRRRTGKPGQKLSGEKNKTRKFSLLSNENFQKTGVFQLFCVFAIRYKSLSFNLLRPTPRPKTAAKKLFFENRHFSLLSNETFSGTGANW